MNCNFDFFGRYERPELILCNPDDSEIGIITNAEDLHSDICLSDISSISYRIYETDNPEYNSTIYDKHIERRQVKVAGVGYFIITGSSECVDESGKYKQIEAKSCEFELNNIAMPYINGTYQLYKADNFTAKDNEEIAKQGGDYLNENCILYEIMKVIPSWTLGGQAELIGDGAKHSAEMKEKYKSLGESFRTFEYSDATVYSFLTNELQDSYGCFVYFNIEERKIQILHQEDVFEVLPMMISEANILNSCEISTTIDSYVNTLNVEGAAGVSIASANPLGNSMIYNFDHDINIGLIDGALKELLEYWKSSMESGDIYNGFYYSSNIVQQWLDAPSKVSEYKFKLVDEVGKGENGNVSEILDNPDFLTNIGLSDGEILQFKTELNDAITGILALVEESNTEVNTGAIENIFFKISRYRINILVQQSTSDYMSVQELNRFLYSAQELKMGIKSELDSLESYKKGYDAQYEALSVTVTDDSEDAKKALEEQLSIVDGYRVIIDNSTNLYTKLLENAESIIDGANSVLTDLYKRNGFEARFTEYYHQGEGYNIEDAKNKAFEMYKALTRYIKQQTYTDDTIIITDAMGIDEKFTQESDLYNSSKSLLEKISIPEYEMTVAAESFLFSKEYEDAISSLSIRSSLYVEIPNGDVPLFHLLKISINYDEPSCELTFGNRIRLSDPTSVFSDLQRTASSAANIVATERVEWGISEEKINELMTQKNSDIDTTFRMMSNSVNKTTMGNDGFKCYSVDENGNQNYGMWCANGVMMFMDRDKDTGGVKPQMAIGRMIKSDGSTTYGFYGQSIIANTVTVDKLVAGALSKGTNYIRNGSFESEIDYWDIPDGAILEEAYRKDLACPTGYKCIYIKSGNTISQTLSSISSSVGNNSYVLSFYYRRNTDEEDKAFDKIEDLKISIINRDTDEEIESCRHTDNQSQYSAVNNSTTSVWNRCYKLIHLPSVANIRVEIQNGSAYGICIDGVMLEKAVDLNDYTPHINETYARYTTINDSGVTVYDGKIRILNNSGIEVFGADEGGNLTLTGSIRASGGDIAGWLIQPESLTYGKDQNGNPTYMCGISTKEDDPAFWSGYAGTGVIANEENTNFFVTRDGAVHAKSGKIGGWTIDSSKLYNSHTGMSTTGTYVFYAGDSSDYNFSVTQKGALFARNAEIDKKLTLKNGNYTMEFDGYTILMKYGNSDKFSSAISFTSTADGFFGSATNNANLAIAGSTKILFGTRPGGDWKGLCEIEHNISGSVFNAFFLKPCTGVLDRAMLGSATQPWTDVWVEGSFGIPIQLSAIIQAISDTIVGLPVVGARALYIAALAAHGITGLIT